MKEVEASIQKNSKIFKIEKSLESKKMKPKRSLNNYFRVSTEYQDQACEKCNLINSCVSSKTNFKKSCEKFRVNRLICQELEIRRLKKVNKNLMEKIKKCYPIQIRIMHSNSYKILNETLENFKKNKVNDGIFEELYFYNKFISPQKINLKKIKNEGINSFKESMLFERQDLIQNSHTSMILDTSKKIVKNVKQGNVLDQTEMRLMNLKSKTVKEVGGLVIQTKRFKNICPFELI